MTHATESSLHHNAHRWYVELTDGTTTLRYSTQPLAVVGTGPIEGRVDTAVPTRRVLSNTLDPSGFDVSLIDTDTAIEAAGVTRGWTVTLKSGFEDLAFASWKTIATCAVAERPERSGFRVRLRCQSLPSHRFGRLTGQPRIDAEDTFLFSTMQVSKTRVGEYLPMRFGSFGSAGGALHLKYLGFDTSTGNLVCVANAMSKSASPSWFVIECYIDGMRLESFTQSTNTAGNYRLLLVTFTLDEAARYGLIDKRQFSRIVSGGRTAAVAASSSADAFGRMRSQPRHAGAAATYTERLIAPEQAGVNRSLTADIAGPYTNPVDLFEYLLQYHNDTGLSARDSTSYTAVADYLDALAIKTSVEIDSAASLADVVNGVCGEIGIEQYNTEAGLHALAWPLDVSQSDASGGFSGATKLSDLGDLVGEPTLEPSTGGAIAPVNLIRYDGPTGTDEIVDSAAATAYGHQSMDWSPKHARASVLARALAWHRIQRHKTPTGRLVAAQSIAGVERTLGERVLATVRSGPASNGWTAHVARVHEMAPNLEAGSTGLLLSDDDVLQSSLSSYMAGVSDYLTNDITGCSFNTSNDYVATSDANAEDVRPGDILWLQSATSGRAYAGRVSWLTGAGPYNIGINRLPAFTASVDVQHISSANGSACLCGDSADERPNTAIDDYLAPSAVSLVEAYPLWGPASSCRGSVQSGPPQLSVGGSPTIVTDDAQFGECISLDGTNDYLYRNTHDAYLTLTGAMSCAIWFRATDLAGDMYLCQFAYTPDGTAANNALWALHVRSTGIIEAQWEYGSGSNVQLQSATGLVTAGKWMWACMTRSAGMATNIYLADNDTAPTAVHTSTPANAPDTGTASRLYVGAYARSSSYRWKGELNGLIVDDAEWSSSVVTNLWTASIKQSSSVLV